MQRWKEKRREKGEVMPRGGKRENAGRPKTKSYSDRFKRDLWKALDKKARADGRNVFDVFADMLFGKKNDLAFCSLWKTLCEVMAAKETKTTVEKHDIGPSIGLPPIKKAEDSPFPVVTTRPN
jgi:hypothetical protein